MSFAIIRHIKDNNKLASDKSSIRLRESTDKTLHNEHFFVCDVLHVLKLICFLIQKN